METRVIRRSCWIIGLIAAAALGCLLPWSGSWGPVAPLALVLTLALFALIGELAALATLVRQRSAPALPRDASPADGAVGVAPMAGVRGEVNPGDPRFRRFAVCECEEGPAYAASARRASEASAPPPLLGRVVLISLFAGRDGRGWSDAEIVRAHAAILRAAAWIEREALRWDAPVNLELADTYFVVDDDTPLDVAIGFFPKGEEMQPFETHAVTKALTSVSRAAAQLGFEDAVALFAAINPRVQADARVWLFHLRQAGHSLAVPLDETMLAGVSLAVCYAREENFPEPLSGPPFTDPVTIVHELLHLFGASDKYGVPLHSFPPKSVTHREVMRLDEQMLSRLRIDPLTAGEIGWGGAREDGQ